jgi:hypothetical protein
MTEQRIDSRRFWTSRLPGWADAERLVRHENTLLLVVTLLIGAVVGLVVVAFIVVTERLGARLYPASGAAWHRLVVPTAGALISGLLLARYFPNARGSGIPQTKTALFLHDGYITLRTALGKFACSCVASTTWPMVRALLKLGVPTTMSTRPSALSACTVSGGSVSRSLIVLFSSAPRRVVIGLAAHRACGSVSCARPGAWSRPRTTRPGLRWAETMDRGAACGYSQITACRQPTTGNVAQGGRAR